MSPRKKRPEPPMMVDVSMLRNPEVILRVKRRMGPMFWSVVPQVLEVTEGVLRKGIAEPDPMAPKD